MKKHRPTPTAVRRALRDLHLLYGKPPDPIRDNARVAAGASEQREGQISNQHTTTAARAALQRLEGLKP
jgi:hypothetical protein